MDILQGPIEYFADFFATVITFAPRFLPGVWTTLLLSFLSILLGTIFGLLATIMKMSRSKFLSRIADIYIVTIRGTPLLLQLFFIFYGLPNMGLEFSRFTSAAIGLGIHSGAYISEIFRGAIVSIDHGQTEAARSLGMTKRQTFVNIILPQAFKRSVPALGNQFIIAIKDSSLASVITISETMLLARQFVAATYQVFPIFFVAGIYYLIIISVLTKLLSMLERRLRVNER